MLLFFFFSPGWLFPPKFTWFLTPLPVDLLPFLSFWHPCRHVCRVHKRGPFFFFNHEARAFPSRCLSGVPHNFSPLPSFGKDLNFLAPSSTVSPFSCRRSAILVKGKLLPFLGLFNPTQWLTWTLSLFAQESSWYTGKVCWRNPYPYQACHRPRPRIETYADQVRCIQKETCASGGLEMVVAFELPGPRNFLVRRNSGSQSPCLYLNAYRFWMKIFSLFFRYHFSRQLRVAQCSPLATFFAESFRG